MSSNLLDENESLSSISEEEYVNDDETFIPCEFCDQSVRFNEYEEHIRTCSQPIHRFSFNTDINELITNPGLLMSMPSQFMINNSNIPLNTRIQPLSNFLNIFSTIINEGRNTSNNLIPQPLISETTLGTEEINEEFDEENDNQENRENQENQEDNNENFNQTFLMFNSSQRTNTNLSPNLISPYILNLIRTQLNPQPISNNEPLIPINNHLTTYPLNISDYDLNNLLVDLMGGNVEVGVSNIKDVISNCENNELSETDVCPICRETFISLKDENINICTTKKCNHKYCEPCINTWLSKHKKCPICMCELE